MKDVLVIDDEVDGLDVVRRLLRTVQIDSDVAISAEQALNALDEEGYRLVVVDLALPGMDGFELMRTLRADGRWAQTYLVAITAFHTPELKIKALENGFNAYFPKPIERTPFLAKIQELLGLE